MPDNTGPDSLRESFANYHASDLYDFIKRYGLRRRTEGKFSYSNLGFAMLGTALSNRAQASYPELVQSGITEPLGLNDTAISLSPEQRSRLMRGYGYDGRPTPAWDLDVFASAGGIRSTAADMLTYLEAQLHPDRTPLGADLIQSHQVRNYITGNQRIALAWAYDGDTGVYAHDGATGGFTSYACFTSATRLRRGGSAGLALDRVPDQRLPRRTCPPAPFRGAGHIAHAGLGPACGPHPIVPRILDHHDRGWDVHVLLRPCGARIRRAVPSPRMVSARLRISAAWAVLSSCDQLLSAAFPGHRAGGRRGPAMAILDSFVLVRRLIPAIERRAASGAGCAPTGSFA